MEVAQNLWQLLAELWLFLEELSEWTIYDVENYASLLPDLFGILLRPSTVYASPGPVPQSQILPIAVVMYLRFNIVPALNREPSPSYLISLWSVTAHSVRPEVCCWNFLGNRLGINSSTSSWWFCSPVAVVPAGVRRRNCVGPSWCRIRFNVSGSCSRSTLWCIVFNVNRLSCPFVLLRVWMNSVSNTIICCSLCWCYELYAAIHSCGGILQLLLLKLLTNCEDTRLKWLCWYIAAPVHV